MELLQNMITINKVIYVSIRVHEEELSSFTAMLVYFISIDDIEDPPPLHSALPQKSGKLFLPFSCLVLIYLEMEWLRLPMHKGEKPKVL